MIFARLAMLLTAATCIGGCATALRGTTQSIWVTSTPPGARCTLWRDGVEAGTVAATPARLTIARSGDVLVVCGKDGHHDGRTLLLAGERESMIREAMRREEGSTASSQQEETARANDAVAVVAGGAATVGTAVGVQALVGAGLAGSTAAAGAAIALVPLAVVAGPLGLVVDASSGAYIAYPPSVSVTLLPRAFSDAEARDAAVARVLAVLDQDDETLRRRFDATCGFTCRRAKPTFDAFLAGRRDELLRQRDAAVLTQR